MKLKNRLLYIFLAVIMGVVVGSIILVINGINPYEAYKLIFVGAFGKPKNISWTIVKSVPIILTGISVAFAFKTGLFNIGAEGQYIMGSIGALIAGLLLDLPPVLHAIVALLIGALFGLCWGGLVGFLKAKFGVNEVISSIMMNWIAFYLSNFLLSFRTFRPIESDTSFDIKKSASIGFLEKWKLSDAGREFLSNHKLISKLLNPPVNWGILIALVAAIIIWYILKKTTLGYRLKAVGYNSYAAEYAGIDIKKSMVISMAIAGLLSGLAGSITVLGVSKNIVRMAAPQGYGFEGLAVSLIANNSPIGCVIAGIFYAGLIYGGGKLTSIGTYSEIINIIIGVMVLFISIPNFIGVIKTWRAKR